MRRPSCTQGRSVPGCPFGPPLFGEGGPACFLSAQNGMSEALLMPVLGLVAGNRGKVFHYLGNHVTSEHIAHHTPLPHNSERVPAAPTSCLPGGCKQGASRADVGVAQRPEALPC